MDSEDSTSVLTLGEWNAAYFLGLESIFQRDCQCNVPEQVLEGARILSASGYRFQHFEAERARSFDGYLTPAGDRERPCDEIANGSFDMVSRAREAVLWLERHVPQVETQWLTGLLRAWDQLHPEFGRKNPSGEFPGQGQFQAPRSPVTLDGARDD